MAVIKAKNSNGVWENVTSATTVERSNATIKYRTIQAASDTTFDLSPYVAPGADFILMFFVYNGSVPSSVCSGHCFVWDSRLNKIQMNAGTGTGLTTNVVWEQNEKLDFTYDKQTCILTVADAAGGDNSKPHFETGNLYYAE